MYSNRKKSITLSGSVSLLSSITCVSLFMTACGSATPPTPTSFYDEQAVQKPSVSPQTSSKQTANAEQQNTKSEDEAFLYLTEEIQGAIAGPNTQEIESMEFVIKNFKASLVESVQGSLPIISFQSIDKADFYQVARCDADTEFGDESDYLSTVELSGTSTANSFEDSLSKLSWDAALSHPKCEIINESLSRTAFIDQNPSQYASKYIIRACAFVAATKNPAGQMCSQLVTLSNTLPAIINETRENLSDLKTKISDLHADLDSTSILLAAKTREFASAVIECEKNERRENLTRHKKEVLHTLIGIGARISAYILSGESLNPFKALKSAWDNRKTILQDSGDYVLGLARDIFQKEKQSIKMCAQAEIKSSEAATMIAEISEKTKTIAELVKEAIASGKTMP